MNMRVVSKRAAGGDHQGHRVRWQRQNQTGDAGKVKPQRKSSSSPSSITPKPATGLQTGIKATFIYRRHFGTTYTATECAKIGRSPLL